MIVLDSITEKRCIALMLEHNWPKSRSDPLSPRTKRKTTTMTISTPLDQNSLLAQSWICEMHIPSSERSVKSITTNIQK